LNFNSFKLILPSGDLPLSDLCHLRLYHAKRRARIESGEDKPKAYEFVSYSEVYPYSCNPLLIFESDNFGLQFILYIIDLLGSFESKHG